MKKRYDIGLQPGAILRPLLMAIPLIAGTMGAIAQEQMQMAAPEVKANTARDGEIAILEEFILAIETNTRAAYELFIARHPEHILVQRAQERIEGLNAEVERQ